MVILGGDLGERVKFNRPNRFALFDRIHQNPQGLFMMRLRRGRRRFSSVIRSKRHLGIPVTPLIAPGLGTGADSVPGSFPADASGLSSNRTGSPHALQRTAVDPGGILCFRMR